jgi:hypothetical protein
MMNGRLWQWLRSSLANGHAAIASLLGLHTTWIMPANVIETHILMNELIVYDCCQSQARHLYYWMDSYKSALGAEVRALRWQTWSWCHFCCLSILLSGGSVKLKQTYYYFLVL